MKQIEVRIGYLGMDGSTEVLDPTVLVVWCPDDRIETIQATWGDRVARGQAPSTYGTLADGTAWETYRDGGGLRLNGYPATDETLLDAIMHTRAQVETAWLAAIADRPDVAAAVEGYRVLLDRMDARDAAHRARWERDVAAIARKFRRRSVVVGEQTVPGKCCVRSARGKLLGYAHVWDGAWLGTVERA